MAVVFARAFTCFGMKPKVSKFFGNHSCAIINEFCKLFCRVSPTVPRRRYTSEVLLFWIFSYLWELEQRERERAEHCVCEEESFESYGFLLKRKVLFEKFAMDNAQKVESEWICRKGLLEFQQ
ncbi:hypothetical protein TNCT_81361 [Trichonephila clavata]|uniref:Uncharacterized protein n=1 Tax=Trichonephila clavata TaxID=2740835 RepID=A0A8X6JAR0_TRICU|nr:hypothetical protein TNCT_81361 [Trichonephila clavata]